MSLNDTFTSTGAKFFWHQEAMRSLRDGRGRPITCHVMPTDICNATCAFCSVQHRAGDILPLSAITSFIDQLLRYGLKSVIISGGGNPILYKDKESGANFNDLVDAISARGLDIGLITNGMPMRDYIEKKRVGIYMDYRQSWGTVRPETLDKLTWVRISMAGLDHGEREVYVPDIDPRKTTLGFSYVAHDIYTAPEDTAHGKVSTPADLTSLGGRADDGRETWLFDDRIPILTAQLEHYATTYRPRYVRLLPNCLEPSLIPQRCAQLQSMVDEINARLGTDVLFVQQKPPAAPRACYLGYIHPVLNCDGYVYPCDSCVLNDAAGHQFANPWRVCRWDEVARIYEEPARSLIADPAKTCPGCVFTRSNELLAGVADGSLPIVPPAEEPEHANFV